MDKKRKEAYVRGRDDKPVTPEDPGAANAFPKVSAEVKKERVALALRCKSLLGPDADGTPLTDMAKLVKCVLKTGVLDGADVRYAVKGYFHEGSLLPGPRIACHCPSCRPDNRSWSASEWTQDHLLCSAHRPYQNLEISKLAMTVQDFTTLVCGGAISELPWKCAVCLQAASDPLLHCSGCTDFAAHRSCVGLGEEEQAGGEALLCNDCRQARGLALLQYRPVRKVGKTREVSPGAADDMRKRLRGSGSLLRSASGQRNSGGTAAQDEVTDLEDMCADSVSRAYLSKIIKLSAAYAKTSKGLPTSESDNLDKDVEMLCEDPNMQSWFRDVIRASVEYAASLRQALA